MRPLPPPETIAQLVSGVTETLFGMSFRLANSPPETAPWLQSPAWTTILLPIQGGRKVTVAVAADDSGGKLIGGQMFSCAAPGVDASMVHDALGELANIVAGQVKSLLALDQALGLPRSAKQTDIQTLSARSWRAATLTNGHAAALVWVAVSDG